MRFFDFAMQYSPTFRRLQFNYEELREKYVLLSSANGAGTPGHANCDTALLARFTSLDADYRALEKEVGNLRLDAELGRNVRRLFKFAHDVDKVEFELLR
jgi:hypothetical protein